MESSTFRRMPLPRDLADALIEVVRERMEGQAMSVNRLAKLVGIHQQTLDPHLKGSGTVGVDEWDAIARELGETLEQLLEAARRRM